MAVCEHDPRDQRRAPPPMHQPGHRGAHGPPSPASSYVPHSGPMGMAYGFMAMHAGARGMGGGVARAHSQQYQAYAPGMSGGHSGGMPAPSLPSTSGNTFTAAVAAVAAQGSAALSGVVPAFGQLSFAQGGDRRKGRVGPRLRSAVVWLPDWGCVLPPYAAPHLCGATCLHPPAALRFLARRVTRARRAGTNITTTGLALAAAEQARRGRGRARPPRARAAPTGGRWWRCPRLRRATLASSVVPRARWPCARPGPSAAPCPARCVPRPLLPTPAPRCLPGAVCSSSSSLPPDQATHPLLLRLPPAWRRTCGTRRRAR
jgi:hypothetical protein